ncbi:phage tail protein [Shouchella patagoniensis]|uniref:phage tail protein n=1 Tax=Shouchella patagoniensis TaxID=228576 RepID=UPI00099554A0|nr:phage tail protein [Shouchella patagoniensis]
MELPQLYTMSGLNQPIIDFDEQNFMIREVGAGERSISFSLLKTRRNAKVFDALNHKEKVEVEGNKYVIDTISKTGDDVIRKSIIAQHEIVDRMRSQRFKQQLTQTLSIHRCAEICFAGSGVTYEIRGSFQTKEFENFGHDDQWTLFKYFLGRFDAEYDVKGTHVIIAPVGSLGINQIQSQIRHDHNLITIEEHIDASDLETYGEIFANWNDETEKYEIHETYVSPNAKNYLDSNGKVRYYYGAYYDERFRNSTEARQSLIARMKDVPDYSITVTLAELRKNGVLLHPFSLFDYVWVIYEPFDMLIQTRVTARTRYPFAVGRSPEIEIGNFRRDISKQMAQANKASKKIDAVAGQTTRALSTATRADTNAKQALETVNGPDGQFQLHMQNTQLHIQPGEREKWNAKADEGDAAWALNEARKYTDAEILKQKGYTDQQVGEVMAIVNPLVMLVDDIDRRLKVIEGREPETE